MNPLFDDLIVIELSCAITYLMCTLGSRRYALKTHILIHAAATAVFLFIMDLATKGASLQYGGETVFWMLAGCALITPLLFFYGGGWGLRVTVFFYILCYVLSIFTAANRAAYLITGTSMSGLALLFQTVLYAGSIRQFQQFSQEKFIRFLSEAAGSRHQRLLLMQTITSFVLIAAYNILMVSICSELEKLLFLLLLLFYIVQTNLLLVSYLQTDENKQEFQLMAATDPLTKLGNSVALVDRLHEMQKEGGAFSLLFMDLDSFKSVNDTHGHRAGDAYLIRFAQALKRLGGDGTFFFRKSGDEFIGLTRDRELAKALKALQPEMEPGIAFLGVSVGCANTPEDGETLAELLDVADRDMYRHKRERREAGGRPERLD